METLFLRGIFLKKLSFKHEVYIHCWFAIVCVKIKRWADGNSEIRRYHNRLKCYQFFNCMGKVGVNPEFQLSSHIFRICPPALQHQEWTVIKSVF